MISKPTKIICHISKVLSWKASEFRLEEKMDGRFHTQLIGGLLFAGEQMRSGDFIAFDCLSVNGQDIKNEPLRVRLQQLNSLPGILRPSTGHGVEFVEAILSNGGEGIVAKRWDAPFDASMYAVKRSIEMQCVVTEILPFQAVKIADAVSGADRGKVKIPAFKASKIRVGSIIKVIGMNLTEKGFIREPRLCSDSPTSWLIKY
jgi:hypothetical protein